MQDNVAMNTYKKGLIFTIIANCLFGLSIIFTKKGISNVSVLTLISWRFATAFLVMTLLILVGVMKVNLKGKPIWGLLWIAVFSPGIYFLAEGSGLQLTTASEGAAILAASPIVTMILSALVLKENPTVRQAISIVASVIGVLIVIAAKGMHAQFVPAGYMFLFLAIFADSMCIILTRKYLVYTPTERVYMMAFLGAVTFTPLAMIEHGIAGTLHQYLTLPFHNIGFLTAVLYLGIISSVLGYTLSSNGIRYLGPNKMASLAGICTLTSVLAGIVFLKESFTLLQGVGTLLILLGAYNANTKSVKKEEKEVSDIVV